MTVIVLFLSERAERLKVQGELSIALLERDKVTEQRDTLIELKEQQLAKIKSFNELSIKHAEEAANAKKEIDSLRANIRDGTKRMYIKASCPKPVSDSVAAGGVGDAGSAEVERATGQDILDLREMNVKAILQINYLQNYIRSQCQLSGHSR